MNCFESRYAFVTNTLRNDFQDEESPEKGPEESSSSELPSSCKSYN